MESDEGDAAQSFTSHERAAAATTWSVDGPPELAVAAAGFDVRSARPLDARGRVWFLRGDAGEIVLRSAQRSARGAWLAGVLAQLSERFPVPRPRRIFDGNHSIDDGTQRWEAFSFLPGTEIGFNAVPTPEAVGAFVARFHLESLRFGTSPGPAPGGTPLRKLHDVVDRDGAQMTMGSRSGANRLHHLLDRFVGQLRDLDYAALPHCVAHGDPTTFNMLANGNPPSPSGLIDFELADIEAAAADIAFCLWRSGRPSQSVRKLDYERVERLIAGYHSVRRLTSSEAAAVTVCLAGRGLQMLVKRTRLGVADATGTVAELEWIVAQEHELERSVLRAIA